MNKTIESGQISAHFGKNVIIIKEDNSKISAKLRTSLPKLVVGDLVNYQLSNNDLVVTNLIKRNNLLQRADKLVAANISQMLIMIAPDPAPQHELIDSYLIAASINNIKSLIVLNKVDALKLENKNKIFDLLKIYQNLNYQIIEISCKTNYNLNSLHQCLLNNTSIIVGQSGVGKTSLLNKVLPNQYSKVSELSNIKQGKHTTSTAQLFALPYGGKLIDSPGVRSFALSNITKEQISAGFIEINQFAKLCKFNDCSHNLEPKCAVITALKEGLITKQRFNSYQYLIANN